MENKSKMGAIITANAINNVPAHQRFLAESMWDVEHWRKGQMLSKTLDHNICTDEGLNFLLNVVFGATAKLTGNWYVELFESDTTPAAGTTYAVPVYTPCTAYTEVTRQEYVDVQAAAKVMTNTASKATFTMNASKTIYGASLVGGGSAATTAGDVAGGGVLYCSAAFSAEKVVESGDVLKITVQITAADA